MQECETNNDYDAHFQFSDDLNMANDQYTVFRGPVASDDEVYFLLIRVVKLLGFRLRPILKQYFLK